ncbi:MAG: hypothetical protein CME01_03425 [Geminicoccus sp.]|nr:hypothetical protein [Geminicoccus sp.]
MLTSFLLLSAVSAQEPARDLEACIEGVVFEANGIAPIGEEIRVQLGPNSTTTDSFGAYSICGDPGEATVVWTRDSGEVIGSLQVRLVEGVALEILVQEKGGQGAFDVSGVEAAEESTEISEGLQDLPMAIIRGLVTDLSGRPLANAQVLVRGQSARANTDSSGQFELEAAQGVVELGVILEGYANRFVPDLILGEAGLSDVRVELPEAGLSLAVFTVTAPRIVGGTADLLEERQQSSGVSDVLGAEQMSRSGDSDAAGALKRVTGLSVVGGRYVYVRGLGERYSASLLNGSLLPSPEPERRVVPLDLFPTSLLESVVIQKTFSPDMPAEFGGGVVGLRTRTIPKEAFIKLGLSTGYVHNSTFQSGPMGFEGSRDWLGFGASERALPQSVSDAIFDRPLEESDMFSNRGYSAEELEALGESMPNTWAVGEGTALPKIGVSMVTGKSWERGESRFGALASGLWGQDWDASEYVKNYYLVGLGDEMELAHAYDFTELERDIRLAGALSLGFAYGDAHDISSTTLINRSSTATSRIYQGFNRDVATDIRVSRIRWVERMLFYNQLRGSHEFEGLGGLTLDWRGAYAQASRLEPDRREYRYDYEEAADAWYLSDRPEGNSIFYSTLGDELWDSAVDLKLPFKLPQSESESWAKAGFAISDRSRGVDTRRLKYMHKGERSGLFEVLSSPVEDIFVPENIGSDGFQFEEVTRQTDNYSASQDTWAAYGMSNFEAGNRLGFMTGVRLESSAQAVQTFELFNPDQQPVSALLETVDTLPAAVATIRIGPSEQLDRQQLRLGYGRTVSRPDFRELSPATFNDVTGGRQIFGNPELGRALIDNVDLRWEFYPEPGESLSAAFFYKHFDSPIESIVVVSAQHSVTYQNADSAQTAGVEFEWRRSLGMVAPKLQDWFASGNVALMRSVVVLSDNSGIQSSNERPLEGQSPYVVNLNVGYEDPEGEKGITLLYNVAGPRITEVGALGAPDYVVQPVHRLDMVGFFEFGPGLKLGLKAKNLLDWPNVTKMGSEVVSEIHDGWSAGLSLSWKG